MTLTYKDVRGVDLATFSTAVDAWGKLPGQIGEAGSTFRTEVAKGLRESDWKGDTAEAACTELEALEYEIDHAASEAKSIHTFLHACLKEFRRTKKALDDIADEVAGHEHLSLNAADGSVYVDADKVEPEQLGTLNKSYQPTVESYRTRTRQAVDDAEEADTTLRWSLRELSECYGTGFFPAAPTGLAEARRIREQSARQTGEKISLKEISDQEIQTRLDNASKGKFGSGTLKPAAEFLGYRSWLNSADSLQKGKWADAKTYFLGGMPAYLAGMEAELLATSGGGGRHRKPTLMNKVGNVGGKVFGFPAAVVATGLDFYYTPAQHASEGPDAKIMAPKDPGKVHWK
ncbi:hypothetical protein [Streptomyces hebeiensis]